jgi:hypothetical protein
VGFDRRALETLVLIRGWRLVFMAIVIETFQVRQCYRRCLAAVPSWCLRSAKPLSHGVNLRNSSSFVANEFGPETGCCLLAPRQPRCSILAKRNGVQWFSFVAEGMSRPCLSWVIFDRFGVALRCPIIPRKRTSGQLAFMSTRPKRDCSLPVDNG